MVASEVPDLSARVRRDQPLAVLASLSLAPLASVRVDICKGDHITKGRQVKPYGRIICDMTFKRVIGFGDALHLEALAAPGGADDLASVVAALPAL